MFDARLRPLIDPPLNWIGAAMARSGVTANQITFASGAVGVAEIVRAREQRVELTHGSVCARVRETAANEVYKCESERV